MKKARIISKSTRLSDLSFDDLYDIDFEPYYKFKIERNNARRLRQLKRQVI